MTQEQFLEFRSNLSSSKPKGTEISEDTFYVVIDSQEGKLLKMNDNFIPGTHNPFITIDDKGFLWKIPKPFNPLMGAQCIGKIGDGRYDFFLVNKKETYTKGEVVQIIEDLLEHADAVIDAIQSEDPRMDPEQLLEMVEEYRVAHRGMVG